MVEEETYARETMGACFSSPSPDGIEKNKKKTMKKSRKEEEEEEEDDEFERAMMTSEYARLQTIKRERAKQRTLSECEKLDVIADTLATIEREKKELANARRHIRDMNRAARAAKEGNDGLGIGAGTVGVAGSSASSRRGGKGGPGIANSGGQQEKELRSARRPDTPGETKR